MIVINGKNYKELRCKECQTFFMYQNIAAGILFFQCPHCGFPNEWEMKYMKTKENQREIEKVFSIGGEDLPPLPPKTEP